jgi:transposase
MDVLHARCAGLDVHKDTIVACVRFAQGDEVKREVQSFAATTRGLMDLSEWMTSHGCAHVAMEATGVYWRPVWHVLEGSFELVLGNAAHIRNVPGRKTDVNDATWIADLLAHGLIRGSFVPPAPIQRVRELTRTRKQLVREVSRHTLRIQKTLEDANIKLTGTITGVLGVSGRAILDALVAGETDPERLADLARRGVKASRAALIEALRGRVTEHHRFLLKLHLGQVDALRAAIAEVDAQLGKALGEAKVMTKLLTTMPGISDLVAQVVVGEIGTDMRRFLGCSLDLLGWALSTIRRERGQAPQYPHPLRRSLAQDGARAGCMGRDTQEEQLPPCSVPASQESPWTQEGHHCSRCLDVDSGLSHAARRNRLRRPRA